MSTADMDGRRVVVVGAGGLGSAVVHLLASQGARVVATWRSAGESVDDLAGTLPAESWAGDCRLDLADSDEVDQVLGDGGTASRMLGGPVDTLVLTAGHRHDFGKFANSSPQESADIVSVELLGPMSAVRAVLPQMTAAGFGRIVCIGSDSGKAGTLGDAASSAARAGINGFIRSIARETARTGVTANVVSPGPTDTALLEGMLADEGLTGKVMAGTVKAIPMGRVGEPQEIARAVGYLVGPNSGFTTGQVLSVSGGLTF